MHIIKITYSIYIYVCYLKKEKKKKVKVEDMRTLYASFHAQNTLHYALASIPIKTTTTTTKKSYPLSLSLFHIYSFIAHVNEEAFIGTP